MTYATTTDVETELGRTAASATEAAQWQAWLDRVERAIVRRFTRASLVLADEIAAGNLTADDVADVEIAAVVRKITNPSGLTSVTRSIDDATITTRREGDETREGLEITAQEWATLLPGAESEAFSSRPGFEVDSTFASPSWS